MKRHKSELSVCGTMIMILTSISWAISGRVINPDSTGKAGVVVHVSGSKNEQIITDSNGYWQTQASTSVSPTKYLKAQAAARVDLRQKRLKVSFNGFDCIGRKNSGLGIAGAEATCSAFRTLSTGDTVTYSWQGKVFLREALSQELSGILIRVFDTLWNPNVIYRYVTDSRDGQSYRTIKIGNQEWISENIRYRGANEDSGYVYTNSSDSLMKYGRYYTWSAALQLPDSCDSSKCSNQILQMHQGVCPLQWHIPTEAEWNALNILADSVASEHDTRWGAAMKSIDSWAVPGGLDLFGFRGLPSGNYSVRNGKVQESPSYCTWWSTTESLNDSIRAMDRELAAHSIYSTTYYDTKDRGNPVRCIKN